MNPCRAAQVVTCSQPACGYSRTIRTADRAAAMRALLDEGAGWELIGPLRDPSAAYCPVHSRERNAEWQRVVGGVA